MCEKSVIEKIKVTGAELVDEVERLIHKGNVTRIVVKQDEHTIAEFPLSVGVVGAVLAPTLAAIGAIAAVITHCTLEIEQVEDAKEPTTPQAGEPPTARPQIMV